jgi:hypothetical protein
MYNNTFKARSFGPNEKPIPQIVKPKSTMPRIVPYNAPMDDFGLNVI